MLARISVQFNYCVIIAAHDPPPIFYATLTGLNSKGIPAFIVCSGSNIRFDIQSKFIRFIKEKNYGVAHKFNTGIKVAIEEGFNLFTLFTDDILLLNDFSPTYIMDYFNKHCGATDILSLNFVSEYANTATHVADFGMTFAAFLANKIM
ncbi:MAG: hypothetical protein QXX17_08270, partial [Conexivisphaerales archaeon]